MVNILKNLVSRNQCVDFDETWYKALEIQAHYILFKRQPCVDLDIFNSKVKFCNFGFYMGKCTYVTMMDTFIASCNLEFGLLCKLND